MLDLETIGVEFNTGGLEKGARAFAETEKAANRAAGAVDAAGASASKAGAEYARNARAADDLSGTFQRLESGALKLSDAENRLIRSLVSEAKQIGMTNAERERYMAKQAGMSDAAAQMAGALRAKIDALKAESAALAQNERAMQSAQTAAAGFARSLVAAVAGGVAFREFVQAADAVTTLNNQLKLATGSADAAKQAYGSLYEIAQRSRVSFTELGTTYASIARATGEMGISQQRLLKVTESIGNAMTTSGGSAQGMQAALVQLGQGFASGTLRGEELNSVMEQTPRLAKAIADGLGISIGKLREMGKAGQLTSEAVVKALESQSEVLKKEVAGATLTVGQAFTQLSNASTRAIGDFDQASGASKALAGAISSIATSMDGMGDAFKRNEGTIQTVMGALTGAAALATLAAIPRAIAAIGGAVTGLGAVLAANPVVLGLLGVGAVAGGAVAGLRAYSKTASGIEGAIEGLKGENERSEAALQRALAGGRTAGADNIRKTIEERKKAIRELNAELALMSSAGIDTRAEDARLAAGTEQYRARQRAAEELAKARRELYGVKDNYEVKLKVLNDLYASGVMLVDEYRAAVAKLAGENYKAEKSAAGAARSSSAGESEVARIKGMIAEEQRYIDALKSRGAEAEKLTSGEKLVLQIQEQLKTSISGAARAHKEEALAAAQKLAELQKTRGAMEAQNKLVAEAEADYRKLIDSTNKGADSIEDQAKKQEAANTVFGKGAAAIAEMTLAELKHQMSEAEGSDRFTPKYIAALQRKIDAQQRYTEALHGGDFKAEQQKIDEWTRSIQEQAKLYEDEAALAGKTQLERAKILALRKVQLDVEKQLAEINRQSYGEDEKERQRQEVRDAGRIAGETAVRKVVEDDWQKSADDINRSLTDALMRGFENGKGFAENLRDTLKNMFNTLVLRPIVQAIVQPITGVVQGVVGGVTGSGGVLGMASNASSLNTIYGAGAQWLTGGAAGASSASLMYANGVGMLGGDSLGALISANGGWAGVGTGATSALGSYGLGASAGGGALGLSAGGGLGLSAGGGLGLSSTSALGVGEGIGAGLSSTSALGVGEGIGAGLSGAGGIASGAGAAIGALWPVALIGAFAAVGNTPASPHTGGASTAGAAVKPADLKAAFDGIDAKTQTNLDKLTGSSTALLNFFSKLSGGQGGYSVSAAYAADGRDAASGDLVIKRQGQVLSNWDSTRRADMVSARDFAMGDYASLLTAQTDSGEAAGMADAKPKIAAMVEDQWAQYLEAVKGDLMAQMQASGADIPAWARKMLAPLADVSAEDFSTELDKITKKIIALPETIAQQIGYNRDTVVNAWVDGLRTGDATAAGIKAADAFVSGIETQMLTSAAGKIQDIVFNGAIVPIVDSLMQGATLSQALAEANLDEVIKKATATAQAFAAVWSNADFQAALAGIHAGYAKVMGDLGTTLKYTPVYTKSTQAAAAAQSDLAAAQSEATRAAEQEAKRLADLHKSLNGDLASLDIELLRRSGQSAAADAAARAKATEGYDAEALALYDLIAIRRAHIADLDAEASRAQQLDGLYAGIYAKIATPAERMAYGYERIAKNLQNAGLFAGQTDLSSILAKASMPQVRDTVQKLWGESSSQTRIALLDAVGGLADLKAESASLADQAEQTALNLATQNADAALAIVQRAIEAEKKAGQERLRLAQTEETRLKSLVDYLHGQALDLYGQTDSTAQWMAAQGQAYIDAALAGGALDRDKLGEAVSAIRATLKPDLFGSAKDMEFQTLVLAGKLGTLEQSTGRQLTAAQRALKAEEDAAKALDDLAQTQRDALDIARGQYTGILGVQDAIKQLSAAILAEKAISGIMQGSIAGSTYAPKTDTLHSAVTGLDYSGASIGGYLKALNAAGDNAGALDAYQQLTANGATSAMVSKLTGWSLDQINTWVDANNLPRFDVGTNYVPRDMLAMVHEGEAIVPRAYNPAAGGGSNSDSEVRALRAEVAALRAELSSILGSIAASSARTADLTDRYTEGGNAARVVAPEPLQVTTA